MDTQREYSVTSIYRGNPNITYVCHFCSTSPLSKLQHRAEDKSVIIMELEHKHIRAMIYYDFINGLSRDECLQRLRYDFGEQNLSKSICSRWVLHFLTDTNKEVRVDWYHFKDKGARGSKRIIACFFTVSRYFTSITHEVQHTSLQSSMFHYVWPEVCVTTLLLTQQRVLW